MQVLQERKDFNVPQEDRTTDDAKARLFNFTDFSEDGYADDEASDASDSSASDLQQHQRIMACSDFALLGVQPFVFLLNDEGTHFHYITKQSRQEPVRKGCCTLDAMQFCCHVLARRNYLEELNARASHSYDMDEIVLCNPQAQQMAGVPILQGQDCIGVLCVVSSGRNAQESIKACRHGLTLATSFLQSLFKREMTRS